MKKERDQLILEYVQLWNENAKLQASMDDARDKNLSLWNTTQVQQEVINRLRKQLEEASIKKNAKLEGES
jgi:vacuolar-type H+-ATPase subunit D/Vma8